MDSILDGLPERACGHCGKRLERKRTASGRLEGSRDFLDRRFCSRSCAKSQPRGRRSDSRWATLREARAELKPACEACGSTRRLQIHHVNKDWTDNSPGNLQTLCVHCHYYWHGLHRRLGREPAQPMPALICDGAPVASLFPAKPATKEQAR